MTSRRKRVAAFTLVEVLAALMFLGIAIPAILMAFSASSRASEAAERTAIASQLAENKLGEIIMLETAAQTGGSSGAQSRGDFGADYPGYRWELKQEPWPQDSTLLEYTVQVFFPVRGAERAVQLTTLQGLSSSTTL